MARSSSGGIAIRYVMTSCFHTMGPMPHRVRGSRNRRNCCIEYNQILLSNKDQILILGCAPRWRPSAILDLFGGTFGPFTERVLRGLYHSAKFGYDRYSSFDNMNVLIFCAFGCKTPIDDPKIGVLWQFDPINGLQYQPKPKMAHPLRVSASFEPST